MTILFAGGEDASFALVGTVTTSGAGGVFRTTFARQALFIGNSTTVADPPANRLQTSTFTSSAVVWIHAQVVANTAPPATTANQQAIIVRSPDGVSRIVVRGTGTNGTLKVSSRNAAGTITDLATATGVFPGTTLFSLDTRIDYSATGGVQMWISGVQVINYSGDPRTDAATQLNQVDFAAVINASNAGNNTYWSEIIVADQDSRSMALWTLAPAAAGNSQTWTPNTLANVNKPAINDATFISATTNNALSEWTVAATPPSGGWSVLGLVQNARVQISATGPQHFDWLARTGAIDYLASAPQAPALAFGNFSHIWPLNPNTGVAWTVADITAAGLNLGIESQA